MTKQFEAWRRIREAEVEKSTALNLESFALTELPANIGQLSQLTELNLSYNQLPELPAGVGQLSQLKTLNLEGIQLTELPAEVGQLSQLTELNLSYKSAASRAAFGVSAVQVSNSFAISSPASARPLSTLTPARSRHQPRGGRRRHPSDPTARFACVWETILQRSSAARPEWPRHNRQQ